MPDAHSHIRQDLANPDEVPCSSDAHEEGMYDGRMKHIQIYSREVSFTAPPRPPPQGPPPPPLLFHPFSGRASDGGGGALSGGAIAAIVCGGMAVFVLLVLFVLYFRRQSVQLGKMQAPRRRLALSAPVHPLRPRDASATPPPAFHQSPIPPPRASHLPLGPHADGDPRVHAHFPTVLT